MIALKPRVGRAFIETIIHFIERGSSNLSPAPFYLIYLVRKTSWLSSSCNHATQTLRYSLQVQVSRQGCCAGLPTLSMTSMGLPAIRPRCWPMGLATTHALLGLDLLLLLDYGLAFLGYF